MAVRSFHNMTLCSLIIYQTILLNEMKRSVIRRLFFVLSDNNTVTPFKFVKIDPNQSLTMRGIQSKMNTGSNILGSKLYTGT